MSDGELKKRIETKIKVVFNKKELYAKMDVSDIFDVIDEAKKEIFNVTYVYYKPKLFAFGTFTDAISHKCSDKPKQGYKKYVSINEEAVKKWFGDST